MTFNEATEIVAIDFEFNQHFPFPPSLKGGSSRGKDEINLRLTAEIIQIGAVKLNHELKTVAARSFFVRPKVYTRLHPHIRRLTKIDIKVLRAHDYFASVFDEFAEFVGFMPPSEDGEALTEKTPNIVFCAWGKDDMTELFRNILFHGKDPFAVPHKFINAQKLANTFLKNPNTSVGLKPAAEALGLETSRPFHDALSDALYTAEILCKIAGDSEDFWQNVPTMHVDLKYIKDVLDARANAINIGPMMSFARKKLGRELNDAEKDLILAVYNAGRLGKFDKT